jgi:hypothetical protein
MPSARPLAIVSPASLNARAKRSAFATPCGVALRLPTIASPRRAGNRASPTT